MFFGILAAVYLTRAPVFGAAFASESNVLIWLIPVAFIVLVSVAVGAVLFLHARQLEMERAWLPGVPVLRWIGFFQVMDAPPKNDDHPARAPIKRGWVLLSFLWPLGICGCIIGINPSYMSLLVDGAQIPFTGIQIGWILIGWMVYCIAAAGIVMWAGFGQRQKRLLGVRLASILFIQPLFVLPALWPIMLGPATVQLIQQTLGY